MGSRRKTPLVYFVEFTAESDVLKDVRGVIEINVRHWKRARQAALLWLQRWGWRRVRVFHHSQIEPRVVAPETPLKARFHRKPWRASKSAVLPARRPGRSSL